MSRKSRQVARATAAVLAVTTAAPVNASQQRNAGVQVAAAAVPSGVSGAAAAATSAPAGRRRTGPRVSHVPIAGGRGGSRSYVGGDLDFSMGGWVPPASGANTEVYGDLPMLQARSHDLARNSPIAVKILETLVSSIVGENGIQPQANTGDKELDAFIDAAYRAWAAGECDAAHDRTMATLQAQATLAWLEGGSMFARRRWRRVSDGLTVPLQLELMEAEYCSLQKNGAGERTGSKIHMGVEFDAVGRRVAYHLYKSHPSEGMWGFSASKEVIRVPAMDLAHLTWAKRPGQVHGVPWLTPAMRDIHELERYERTERIRKEQETRNAAFVIADEADEGMGELGGEGAEDDPDGLDGGYVGPSVVDSAGRIYDEIPANAVAIVHGAKNIQFAQPTQNAQYESYVRTQLRKISSACLIPYERVSSDFGQVNFSTYRAGDIEYRRLIRRLQRQVIIPLFCQRVWDWFIDALAVMDPRIPAKVPATWYAPRFEALDPLKDVEANAAAVEAGFRTRKDVVGEESGADWRDVLTQLAEEEKFAKGLGLQLGASAGAAKAKPPATASTE